MYHFISPGGWGAAVAPPPFPPSVLAAPAAVSGLASSEACGGVASLATSCSFGSCGVPLSINQLREVRPNEVEQTENQRRDHGHHDDDDRGRTDFLRRRPGHLLQLARNLVGERSEEHTSELQSRENLVCRLLLE